MAKTLSTRYVTHTVESLMAATNDSESTIRKALKNGWFGPVKATNATTTEPAKWRMQKTAVQGYIDKNYEKVVIQKSPQKEGHYAYKYTRKEAIENAEKRADQFMEDPERVRIAKLSHPEWSDDDVRSAQVKTFLKQESKKKIKVDKTPIPIDKEREILEMPLGFSTLVLEKLTSHQSVYMMEKVSEYCDQVGVAWGNPWVRHAILEIIQEEIHQKRLRDLQRIKITVDDDEALTKSINRWAKLTDMLFKHGSSGEGEKGHERESMGSGIVDL